MRINLVGAFVRNFPFGTEIAFKKGFDRLGGHRVTTLDPSVPGGVLDHDADATVVFKTAGPYNEELLRCGGRRIVYQPDDLRFPHIQEMMKGMLRYCDHALTFDDDGARLAREYGYASARRLLLTADDDLYRPGPVGKQQIDLSFVGSMTTGDNHRSRREMVHILKMSGLSVFVASDLYDVASVAYIYRNSKVVLNHATDVGQGFGRGFGYQCRHFEAGFTRACVLSNSVVNEDPLPGVQWFSDPHGLVDASLRLLRNPSLRSESAQALYDELRTRHRPEHRAQEMVDIIGSLP